MGSQNLSVKHFLSEPITVQFLKPPQSSKKPSCPDGFTWREEQFVITACLSEGKDFSRRGRMANNMQPQHALRASKGGSWGVGRFYFEVETQSSRLFRLYYDRAPKHALDRGGQWILVAELVREENDDEI